MGTWSWVVGILVGGVVGGVAGGLVRGVVGEVVGGVVGCEIYGEDNLSLWQRLNSFKNKELHWSHFSIRKWFGKPRYFTLLKLLLAPG